jgi:hypothetical protein
VVKRSKHICTVPSIKIQLLTLRLLHKLARVDTPVICEAGSVPAFRSQNNDLRKTAGNSGAREGANDSERGDVGRSKDTNSGRIRVCIQRVGSRSTVNRQRRYSSIQGRVG